MDVIEITKIPQVKEFKILANGDIEARTFSGEVAYYQYTERPHYRTDCIESWIT